MLLLWAALLAACLRLQVLAKVDLYLARHKPWNKAEEELMGTLSRLSDQLTGPRHVQGKLAELKSLQAIQVGGRGRVARV